MFHQLPLNTSFDMLAYLLRFNRVQYYFVKHTDLTNLYCYQIDKFARQISKVQADLPSASALFNSAL